MVLYMRKCLLVAPVPKIMRVIVFAQLGLMNAAFCCTWQAIGVVVGHAESHEAYAGLREGRQRASTKGAWLYMEEK